MEETGCEIICGAPTTLAVKEDMMMIAPFGFLPWEIRIAIPEESQLRQSRATFGSCCSVYCFTRMSCATTASLKPSFRAPWRMGDAVSTEEMLDGQRQRVDIPAHGRSAHNNLPHKRLEEKPC